MTSPNTHGRSERAGPPRQRVGAGLRLESERQGACIACVYVVVGIETHGDCISEIGGVLTRFLYIIRYIFIYGDYAVRGAAPGFTHSVL